MTNIRKCATTGQQTDLSHFRRENDSQVYLPKTKVTMTMKDSGTQPPLVQPRCQPGPRVVQLPQPALVDAAGAVGARRAR